MPSRPSTPGTHCPSSHHPFFFYSSGPLRDLHSFPTRRSSDLGAGAGQRPGELAQGLGHQAGLEADVGVAHLALDLGRSEEHTSELQSRGHLVCRLLLEKKKVKSECRRSYGGTDVWAYR